MSDEKQCCSTTEKCCPLSKMPLSIAVLISGILIAASLYFSAPRYTMGAVPNSTNPAAWKLDMQTGDLFVCATSTDKDAEASCSKKFKQF